MKRTNKIIETKIKIPKDADVDVESAKKLYRELWQIKIELECEIELEIGLDEAVKTIYYQYNYSDYEQEGRDQASDIIKQGPLQKQVEELRKTLIETPPPDDEIHLLENEVNNLEEENLNLAEMIENYEDTELHELRAQKQHIDLLKSKV